MTKEEARLFFPFTEEDDLNDLYEERLFEYKQFFLTRPVVKRVFQARLDKLLKMDAAYRVVVDQPESEKLSSTAALPVFPDEVLKAYQLYEQEKAKMRQQLALARDVATIRFQVDALIELTAAYQQKWMNESVMDESINVSKEPDPMELLRSIRAFEEAGGQTFADVPRINADSVLLNEMKRVSLLLKKFG